MVLAVVNPLELVDVPDNVPEITPALNPPFASRRTNVFAVLLEVAAVNDCVAALMAVVFAVILFVAVCKFPVNVLIEPVADCKLFVSVVIEPVDD